MADLKPTDLGLPPKFTEFRSDQFDTAATIAASDKRFVVLASPTGSGKSVNSNSCSEPSAASHRSRADRPSCNDSRPCSCSSSSRACFLRLV